MHGACTTISVYENLSKNSFFVAQQKHPPAWLVGGVPVLRVQRYDFSANLQRNRKDFLRKIRKKSVEWTINGRERAGIPYCIIYRVYKKKKKKQEEKRETRITIKKIVRTLLSMRTTYL
jgi:hypothetical protein